MTESEVRINLSRNINKILNKIYANISNNSFDLDVDLSDIPSTTLKDFWLYTTGFLGLKNQEEFDNMLSDEEVFHLLNGDFIVRNLPFDQAQRFAEQAKKKYPVKVKKLRLPLYTIQDGKYSLVKGCDDHGDPFNYLILETDPMQYRTDKTLKELEVTPRLVLKTLRNVFAHNIPLINNNQLIFRRGDDEIVVSKMWLRGYTEFFHNKYQTLNSSEIQKIIKEHVERESNPLETKQDVDKALSSVKHFFGEDINKSFYKLSNFFQTKIASMPNFYSLPQDEKIQAISSILANNYDYITTNIGSISPSIIYNLQQIVGQSLTKRGEVSDLSIDDYDVFKMKELIDSIENINTMSNMMSIMIVSGKQYHNGADKIMQKRASVKSKIKAYLADLRSKQSLETTNMNLFNHTDLSSLPPEVAFNTIILMCFNSIITSSFYDDLITRTKLTTMNSEQKSFFNKFNLDSLDVRINDKQRIIDSPENKFYTLLCLREALCHGTVTYQLPKALKGESCNFNDTVICFKTNERQNAEICGTVGDFYKLFSSNLFFKERPLSIVTGKQTEYSNDFALKSEEDEQNYRDLNEIVQTLEQFDELLSK